MAKKKFWIMSRHNPQLGVYYRAQGQMTIKEARAKETNCIYGSVYMTPFNTEEEYQAEIDRLKADGQSVR